MKKFIIIVIVLLMSSDGAPLGAATVDAGSGVAARLDRMLNAAHQRIYSQCCDAEVLDLYRQSFRLAQKALAANPDDFEVLWRGARSAALFCETANDLRTEGWRAECIEIGREGYRMGTRAQAVAPQRVEGYFWRTYVIGGYRYGLGEGMQGAIAAIREGFLGKVLADTETGYRIDPGYLGHSMTYTYTQFLSNIPAGVYLGGYGLKKARFEQALRYYDEFASHYSRDNFKQQAFQWDVKAPYSAAFLVEAVKVLDLGEPARRRYLDEARWLCKLGMESRRNGFRRWSNEILAEIERLSRGA